MATAVAERTGPPDTRGGTAPLPTSTFGAGIAALAAVLGGEILVQVYYAVAGGPLTDSCRNELAIGINKELPRGALVICHIVEGFRSPAETALLFGGIAVGL